MLLIVLRNHFFVDLVFVPLLLPTVEIINVTHPQEETSSFFTSLCFAVVYYVCFEVAFYFGHRLLHVPVVYRFSHKLHHKTFADAAVSTHYMDIIDYILEGMM